MKRKYLFSVIFVFFVGGLLIAPLTFAQVNDLTPTGLLPTNPFYFFKEWRRDAQQFFTFNPVSEAELQLNVLNEKAEELKKLNDIDSGNQASLETALKNYGKSLAQLKAGLGNLSKSSQADSLFGQLVSQTLLHLEFFETLKSGISENNYGLLNQEEKELAGILISLSEKFEDFGKLESQLEQAWKNSDRDLLSNLQAAEALNVLEEFLPADGLKEIEKSKQNLILAAEGEILADNSLLDKLMEQLKDAGRGSLDAIQFLDELRGNVGDNQLKNRLSIIRQGLLDNAEENQLVLESDADVLIQETQGIIDSLDNKKSKFNLDQAQVSFTADQFVAAFGQASVALAAAKNSLAKNWDFGAEIQNLKSEYDDFSARTTALNPDQANPLPGILDKAEKDLANAADLLNGPNPNLGKIDNLVRETKILLAEAGQLLSN